MIDRQNERQSTQCFGVEECKSADETDEQAHIHAPHAYTHT